MTRMEMRLTIKKKRGAAFEAIYFQRARAAPGGPCVWSSVRLGRPNRQPAIPTAAPPKTAFSIVCPRSEPLLTDSCRSCGRRFIDRADRYCALPSRLPVIENESAGVNRDSLKTPTGAARRELPILSCAETCLCVCVCVFPPHHRSCISTSSPGVGPPTCCDDCRLLCSAPLSPAVSSGLMMPGRGCVGVGDDCWWWCGCCGGGCCCMCCCWYCTCCCW